MYNTLYYSEYKDLGNNLIRVEILKDGYSGSTTELMLSNPAVTIDYKQDDYFKPLKKSGASINLLVPNVIQNLFSGELLNPQVRIYRNGDLFWFGYITPNIYSQEYKNEYDVLTLECVDSISNLANLDFSQSDNEISSFFDILTRILDIVDTEKVGNTIYIQKSIAVEVSGSTDILSNLYIQERNFFDEKGEPQKTDEVLSDILQYLGFQMVQYKNAFYIIDVEAIKNNNYNFLSYDRTTEEKADITLNLSAREVNSIGIGLGSGNVSLGGVYNKVTLIANNNPLGAILPEFDDEEDIVNQNADKDKQYEEDYTFDDETHVLLSGYFKSKANWDYTIPSGSTEWAAIGTQIDEVTPTNRDTITTGIFWQYVDSYNKEDGEPSSLNWKLYLTMAAKPSTIILPSLKLNSTKTMILDGGYLIINMKYKFSTDYRAHSVVRSMYDSSETFGSCRDLTWNSDTDNIGNGNWPNNTLFPCRLTIDNFFFDGETWRDYDWFNARVERGYYNWGNHNPSRGHVGNGDTNWYRIMNDYGDWEYVTKATYNSSSRKKEMGKSVPNNMCWWTVGNTKVFFPKEYDNECLLQDRFYLVHRNKVTETIYDTDYNLTNTVSYKMNIVDSSDGIAVKCPNDFAMYGKLNFELYACSKLGNNPQYRSDTAATTLRAIHISDLTIKYSKSTSYNSIYNKTAADPDITYSNVIDSGYCQEMEDIELRVNSESDIATSYSYVMGKKDNKYYYIKSLNYNGTDNLQENRLIERYVNHYSKPKYKYGNTLVNNEVTPFSLIREHNLNKTMIVTNASYDLTNNRVEIESEQL